MLCVRCQTDNIEGSRFCDACGEPIARVCEGCGHGNRAGARFCASCGCRTGGEPGAASAPSLITGPVPAERDREPVPLMPAKLAAQVLDSRFAREGERKLVTILFADIRGSTELIHGLDPEQALQRLDPTLRIMTLAVHRFGGTVNRTHGDGIMALFGAPQAHEDHAVRACFAARGMLDEIATGPQHGIDIRVGLHSGEVVVRSIGNDMSMEYEAVGSTAHLAARMEQLARSGTAVLSAETARLAEGFIVARSLGRVAVKGVPAPMELFELTGTLACNRWEARAAGRTLTAFVGRAAELDTLLQGLQRARAGRGVVMEIVGEAGMGKSRLIHEYIHHPTNADCRFVCAAAAPYDANTPYFFLSGLIRALLGASAHDSPAAIDDKLVATAGGPRPDQTAALTPLRALLDLPYVDAEWDTLDAPRRRQRTHEAARAILAQPPAGAALVLILEDLHWVDQESLGVLKVAVGSLGVSRLMVVATSRPEFESGWPRYSYSSLLRLAPLEQADADRLLRHLLGDGAELARLRQLLIARTGGEPLFLEEMSRALIETGALQRDGDGFRLTRDYENIEVPSSLKAVIASRIDRLPMDSRALLQIASVIGKDVAIGPLRAVADVSDAQLLAQLATLQSLEFLHEVSKPPHLEYTFKHAVTHAVTYDGLLLKHRRTLHARVMAVIERLHADRLDEFTERLAQHAVRAEDHAKAVEYNYKAGLRANARSAYPEATLFLDRALQALQQLPDTAANADRGIDIRLGLRVALLASGDLMQVRAHLEQAEALARALDDRRRLMQIVISRATILVNLGALGQAVEAGLLGRALAEQAEDGACYVSACFALGQAYWNRGDFATASQVLSRGVERAGREPPRSGTPGTTGSVPVLCRVSLSHTHAFMGELARAVATADEALALARETARPYDLSYAHAARGLADLTLGHLEDAIRHLEEALHFSEAADIKLLMPHAARYLGRAYALAGRLEEARTLLEAAVDYAGQRALTALHGWCAAALGLTHLLGGDRPAARQAAHTAWEIADRHDHAPLRAHTARLLGNVAAEEDGATARAEAEDWFRRGATVAREIGMQPELGHAHLDLGRLLVRTGRPTDARSAFTIASHVFHCANMPLYGSQTVEALTALNLAPESKPTLQAAPRAAS